MLKMLKKLYTDRQQGKQKRALEKLDEHMRQSRWRHLGNSCMGIVMWFGMSTIIMSFGAVAGWWNGALGSWLALWGIVSAPLLGLWTISALLPSKTAHNDVLFRVLREHPQIGSIIEVVQGKIERKEVGNLWVRDFFGLANAYLDTLPEDAQRQSVNVMTTPNDDDIIEDEAKKPQAREEGTIKQGCAVPLDAKELPDVVEVDEPIIPAPTLNNPYHPAICGLYLTLNDLHTKTAFVTDDALNSPLFKFSLKRIFELKDVKELGLMLFFVMLAAIQVVVYPFYMSIVAVPALLLMWATIIKTIDWAEYHMKDGPQASETLRKEVLELLNEVVDITPHVERGAQLLISQISNVKLSSTFLTKVREHLQEIVAVHKTENAVQLEEMAQKLQEKLNPQLMPASANRKSSLHLTP